MQAQESIPGLIELVGQYPAQFYRPNQTLEQSATDAQDCLWYLDSGLVKMTSTSAQGQTVVVHVYESGSIFPLFALLDQDISRFEFTTLASSRLRRVPKAKVVEFFETDRKALFELELRTLRGLYGVTRRLEQAALGKAYDQIAGLFVYFARHFSEAQDDGRLLITLRITHQTIAEWLGLSRENVTIHLKELEKQSLITKLGTLFVIPDLGRLTAIADPFTLIENAD